MKKITLLDCTLRDGGYYNNWDLDLLNQKVSKDHLGILQIATWKI